MLVQKKRERKKPRGVVQLRVGGRVCLPVWDDIRVDVHRPRHVPVSLSVCVCVCVGSGFGVCMVTLTCHMTKKMSPAHRTRVSM